MTQKILLISIAILSILAACTSSPEPTLTPTLSPTLIPAPSQTPDPFINLTSHSFKISGVDTHGNMICVSEAETLGLPISDLKISVTQNNHIKDADIEAELIKEKFCFEIVDAKYTPDQPISVSLSFEDSITRKQIDIGIYKPAPFMYWFFDNYGIRKQVNIPNQNHPDAYDFAPASTSEYPDGLGQPVHLPSSGILITAENGPEGYEHHHNMFFYLPDVGYYIQIGHTQWLFSQDETKQIASGTVIGNLTNETGWPHVHTTLRIPPSWNRLFYEGEIDRTDTFVDIINPHIQLGGDPLPCGFFICSTLPDILVSRIQDGSFEAEYDSSIDEVILY